jgi:hypothetical protein
MTSDLYEHVSIQDGPIDIEMLQKLSSNSDYLYEHQFSGYMSVLGVVRDRGLTFRIGHAKLINTGADVQVANIYFNRPFLPGMRPVVFLSGNTDQRPRWFMASRGLDGRAIPDHRGFHLIISQAPFPGQIEMQGEQYVSYLAIAPSG